jgi:hypothetical protein
MPPDRGPEVPDLTPFLGTQAVRANLEQFRAALTKPGARLSDVARDVDLKVDESFLTYLDAWPAAQAQKLLDLLRAVVLESEPPRGLAIGWIDSDDGGAGEPQTIDDLEVIVGDWYGDPVPVIVRSPHP